MISDNPFIVTDVAHNEDGIVQLLSQSEMLLKVNTTGDWENKLHIVLGMAKDKEVEKVLSLLPTNARYYFTAAHIPRALAPIELMRKATEFGLQGGCFEDVNDAIQAAKQQAVQNDLIIVCGSVFLVGEVNEQ